MTSIAQFRLVSLSRRKNNLSIVSHSQILEPIDPTNNNNNNNIIKGATLFSIP